MPEATLTKPTNQGQRLITNVLWSWTGVAASLFQGIVITRLLVGSLSTEYYGIWVLVFSILDYFWLFDLGLNTAVTNFCARFRTLNQPEKINEVISTSLFYFSLIGICVWLASPFLASHARYFFNIRPQDEPEFARLLLIVGVSWGLCIMLHLFLSALEGFQRFDLTSRVMVIQVAIRCAGYYVALKLAHEQVLVRMAEVFVGSQILGYLLHFINFRGVFPELRISRGRIHWDMFRDIFRYGMKSFVANGATMGLNSGGAVMVAHYLSQSAVGFYTLPGRMLQQAVDAVSRIGLVTRSNAAELSAAARRDAAVALGIYSNRYSLTMFLSLACYLLVYGRLVILRWVGPVMAESSGPLLPIFLFSYALVLAAQFNSSSLLFGVGEHGGYARGLVVEAVLYIAGLAWVIPRYGILGAAWVSAILMIGVRGVFTPWLVSRALDYPFWSYMNGIYVRPLLSAIPAIGIGFALQETVLPGKSWFELILAGAITAGTYMAVAMFACIAPQHRALFVGRIPVLGPRLLADRA